MGVNPGSALLRLRFVVASWKEDTRTDVELLRRFVQTRDDQAFTTLVGRHSELVWGVCLRVLRNSADAEDAVQATFLRLARDAQRIVKHEALAGWLLRVARACAIDLQRSILRQRRIEERLAECVQSAEASPPSDLRVILDDELEQLPESYRTIVILCCLEGRTYADVALELGCSIAAVHRRLVRAQTLLRRRIAKRGPAAVALLSTVFLGLFVPAASAAPPLMLARTVEAGLTAARTGEFPTNRAGEAAAANVTSNAVSSMKASGIAAALAAVAILVGSVYAALIAKPDDSLPQNNSVESRNANAVAPQSTANPSTAIAGVVRGPDGAPVAGAEVIALARRPFGPAERGLRDKVLASTTTNATGNFALNVPDDFDTWFAGRVVTLHVSGADLAPGTLPVRLRPTPETVELKLSAATPLRGKCIDDNGQPAVGVRVKVVRIGDAVAEPVVGGAEQSLNFSWSKDTVTGTNGEFLLPGLGGSTNVWVRVIDSRFALDTFRIDSQKPGEVSEIKLEPATPLVVEVQAADTGRVIAGARVTIITDRVGSHPHFCVTEHGILGPRAIPADIDAVTDERGRVQVRVSQGEKAEILVHAPASAGPYVGTRTSMEIGTKPGGRSVVVRMPRGRWVNGTVTDAAGKPFAGVAVHWGRENATLAEYRDEVLVGRDAITRTASDGSFRLAVLPGACSIRVYGPTLDFPPVATKLPGTVSTTLFAHSVTHVDVPESGNVPRVNVALRSGTSVIGQVELADNKHAGFLLCSGRVSPVRGYASLPLPISTSGEFTVPGCRADHITRAYFLDPARRVGGVFDVAPGVTPKVQLTECGGIRFRVIDSNGQPCAGRDISALLLLERDRVASESRSAEPLYDSQPVGWFDPVNYLTKPKTNAEGIVELPALIPGARYAINVGVGENRTAVGQFTIEAGKTITLPDVILPSLKVGHSPRE